MLLPSASAEAGEVNPECGLGCSRSRPGLAASVYDGDAVGLGRAATPYGGCATYAIGGRYDATTVTLTSANWLNQNWYSLTIWYSRTKLPPLVGAVTAMVKVTLVPGARSSGKLKR